MQETHSTPDVEISWKNEWGGDIIFSHGSSRSRGVAILLPKLSEYKIKNVIQNPGGRYIITEIECFRDIYTFVNIYAPTQDKEKEQLLLLETLLEDIVKFEGKNLIYGGDFNIIFDPKLDKKGGSQSIIESFDLCDIWRLTHEDKCMFTWHCKKKKIFSRLDYWFISEQKDSSKHFIRS